MCVGHYKSTRGRGGVAWDARSCVSNSFTTHWKLIYQCGCILLLMTCASRFSGMFVCMFVSRWWKASQIRLMCQSCRGVECSTVFLKTQPPIIALCPGRKKADSTSSKAPLPVLGKRRPAPLTCSSTGSLWSVGFVRAIFRRPDLAPCLGVVRTWIWITRMSGRGEL